jgi:hypothetical protein
MDKKAKDILFNTYWQKGCWVKYNTHYTNPVDFEYAKEKGLMFDPITISHDDCISRIKDVVSKITIEQVAKAFLVSLSSHRLELRSAITSFFMAKYKISPHKYEPSYPHHTDCEVCREYCMGNGAGYEYYKDEDLNVLNFERIKWGGVRYGMLLYTLFDLEQFIKEESIEPAAEDIEILKAILKTVSSCGKGVCPSTLRDKLKDIPHFKATKSELTGLLEVLACIEILKPASYDRPIPHTHDWTYVTCWRGEDGYSQKQVDFFFGKYI